MNDKTRDKIIKILEKGEDIPFSYKECLFPEDSKREYELVYDGKERKEDILADTMSVPFQPIKKFGDVKEGDWHNMLIFGDNLQALKHLLKLKDEGKLRNPDGKDGVKLIYIDPPFATKQDFQGIKGEKAYQDKIAGADFFEFLRKRFVLLRELLADDGTIYVNLDFRSNHYIKIIMDEIFRGYEFAEIVWICGLMGSGKFYPKSHETVFCYKPSNAYFDPPKRLGYSPRITNALQKDGRGWYYTRGRESSGGSKSLKTYSV